MISMKMHIKVEYKLALLFLFLFQSNRSISQVFTGSNLPIVLINTDINTATQLPFEILDATRTAAEMKIIKRPDGTRNFITDQNTVAFINYTGRISIEIRGSTSQMIPKKPYSLTTLLADNVSTRNVSLLGMPKENDWTLNNCAFEPSYLRDYLSYNLSRLMNNYAPRLEYCEVVLNGEYIGLYLLSEKIKADSNRVNILKIAATDNTLPNITGGYITKTDKTTGGDPIAWTMNQYQGDVPTFIHDLPNPVAVTPEQNTYIHNEFTKLETSTHSQISNFASGYPSIIDVPTFVDFMIMNELSSNVDGYQYSTYFHKERNGKLRAGPIWDFNLTYGNDLFEWGFDRSFFNVWQFYDGGNTGPRFWKDLYDNPTFKCYLSKRWNEMTQPGYPLNYNAITALMDATVLKINEAVLRDKQKWAYTGSFPTEITNMKTWISSRINWITTNVGGFTACNSVVVPPLVITKINYNPATSALFHVSGDLEFIEITNAGSQTVNLTGVYFKELGFTYQFPANSFLAAAGSIYLASNLTTFQAKNGFAAFGQFTRNLSNSTENLLLADGFGNTIDEVVYFDSAPWPTEPDGSGSFLQLISTTLDNNLASSWIAAPNLETATFDSNTKTVIFPNPTSGSFSIHTNSAVEELVVTDICGKTILKTIPDAKTITIDLNGFEKGVYFIKMRFDSGYKTEKIVKQ